LAELFSVAFLLLLDDHRGQGAWLGLLFANVADAVANRVLDLKNVFKKQGLNWGEERVRTFLRIFSWSVLPRQRVPIK
jgi:hypothetical protein